MRPRLLEILRGRITAHRDPLWREAAHWGIVIGFFSLPLVVMIIHLTIVLKHVDYRAHQGEFSYLWNFHRILAGLLAAVLGLNSWDKHDARKNGGSGTELQPPAPPKEN